MTYPKSRKSVGAYLLMAIPAVSAAFAQAVTQPEPAPDTTADQTVTLSPFTVSATNDDTSYTAKDTLAGNRTRTDLADVGSSVQVVTEKFLDDTNSRTAEDLLVLLTDTEVSGQGGNFVGQGNGAALTGTPSLIPTTRVRGLDAADLTEDFFLTRIPFDTYNTSRVDIQRGPNAILFGIGSPGGIINSTDNTAIFENTNKIENQVASYGSLRDSADFNRVLIANELAIRISALDDDTRYRQVPAYKDDHRIYGALHWDPHFLNKGSAHTSFTANAEHGRISGEAPMNTPPLDAITPFYTSPYFKGATGTISTIQNPNTLLANNPWLTENPAGSGVFNNTAFEAGGSQGVSFYGDAFDWPNTAPKTSIQGLYRYMGIVTYDTYAENAGLPGSDIGAYRAKSITDPSIFNFYDKLLYGPNANENDTFNTFTANLSQTFFNNRVGFDISYNHQSSLFTNYSLVSAEEAAISVDVVNTLPDGQANPNVGRPFVIAGPGNGSWSQETRDTLRATGFAELNFGDFLDKNSTLAQVLGRDVFTGLIDRYKVDSDNQTYQDTYISPDPNNWQSLSPGDGSSSSVETALVYLGGSVVGNKSPAGLNLSGITAPINYGSTTMPEYNNETGTFVNAPIDVINNEAQPNGSKLYQGATLQENVINSHVVTWQGYFFDGLVVPMAGYRVDSEESYITQAPALQGTPWVNLGPSAGYQLPTLATATASGHSDTYSIVGHLPGWLRDKLPGRIDISPFYNQSQNFQPSAGRVDIYGNPLPSPDGKTKEYGVTITALNDRVSLKITRYHTSADNVSVAGGGGLASNLLVSYGWGQSQYYAITNPTLTTPFSSFLRVNEGTTSQGQTLYFAPPGSGPYTQTEIDNEYSAQQSILSAWATGAQLPASIVNNNNMTNYGDPATYASAFSPNSGEAITADTASEGTEFELSANPIAGLNVSFNASHTTATESNLASSFVSFYNQAAALWAGPAGNMTLFGPGPNTARSWFQQYAAPQYNLFVAEEGTDVPELRPWRANVTADYTFQSGILKGAHFGGDYRWEDSIVTGYPVVTVNGADTYDVNHPYHGSTIGKVDLWVGYRRRLSKYFVWRTQINVRNLFPTNNLSVVTAEPDGSPAAMGIPEPRVISWTNTLEF